MWEPWDKASLPKQQEGGLEIRNLEVWNRAAMIKHIWHTSVLIRTTVQLGQNRLDETKQREKLLGAEETW